MLVGQGGVSLADYDGIEGFGVAPVTDIIELNKALTAGYDVVNQVDGSALRVESLENSLKILTYRQQALKLWQQILKLPAFSTVEEFNQLTQWAPFGVGVALPEGVLPEEENAQYIRQTTKMKYFGTTRVITHQMSLVKTAHGDIFAQENEAGILHLLRGIESALFFGDASLAPPNKEGVEFDGLDILIDSDNVIDLEGQPFTESDIETGSLIISDNWGEPSNLFMSSRAKSDLTKQFYPRERINMPAPRGGVIGFNFDSFSTDAANIAVQGHQFLQKAPLTPTAATDAGAPPAPATVAGALNATGNGDFAKSGAGDYSYEVCAGNRLGLSAKTVIAAAVSLADVTDQIDLTITNSGSPGDLEYFAIFRTRADGSDHRLIAKIPAADIGGGQDTVFNDLNPIMSGYSKGYMLDMSPQVIAFKQLAPLMKMDLARIAPSYRWMILLYGALQLYAPKKAVRYINVGEVGPAISTLAETQASLQFMGGGPDIAEVGPFL